MAEINESALQVIFDDYTCDRIFGIDRAANFLHYDSSRADVQIYKYLSPMIHLPGEQRDFAEEWSDYFPFYIEQKEGKVLLDLRMDEIMHHTSVSFPTVLLFKQYTPSFDYTISCRQMPNVKKGTIKIAKV